MKVLLAHNFYSSAKPSGENVTVREIRLGLEEAGVDVRVHGPSNDDIEGLGPLRKARVGARPIWPLGRRRLGEVLDEFEPDILQVHNVYPFISPRELHDARRRGVPVVHFVHNYRHSCITGTHFRAGAPCFECTPRRAGNLAGLRHACFRGSAVQSAIMTLSNDVHFSTWRSLYYTCISEHMRRYLVDAGFPAERIEVIPNSVGSVREPVPAGSGNSVLFAGRLEAEKGVAELLAAWAAVDPARKAGAQLHIAGDGPESDLVAAAAASRPDVVHHGLLRRDQLEAVAAGCKASVVPSRWEEPFGRTVIEAFRAGRGVVVSDRGALPELVTQGRTGWIARDGVAGLRDALTECLAAPAGALVAEAQRTWRENYTREVVTAQHLAHYEGLLRDVVSGAGRSGDRGEVGRGHA